MNQIMATVLATLIAIPSSAAIWLISFFGIDQGFWASNGIAAVSLITIYFLSKGYMNFRFIKSQGLTRKEYKYIDQNLKEAKEKINRLGKALFHVKQLPQIKQNMEIMRISRKIYTITRKEPKRFYLAEKFYFYHLDSLVELAEKYTFLLNQPSQNKELLYSLRETKDMMEQLKRSIEKDLDHILSVDLEQLQFEMDVAKKTIKKLNDPNKHDEGRRF